MTFKELKSGYPLFLFDRSNMRYDQAKVMSVSMPRADLTAGNYGKMLVDVTIQTTDGKQNTYSVADSERSAYAGTLMLTTDKEFVSNEVRAMLAQSEETLSKIEETRKVAGSCKRLLEELDTTFKEKQATESRFRKIEEKMDKILDLMESKRL